MKTRKLLLASLASLALVPVTAMAVDGVILIDQNRALAGNVTPGDTAGFPVTIGQPGSYRLSGNLTTPANTHGVVIASAGVTLDLNGFSIISGGGGAGIGIANLGGAHDRVTVRNGQVNGFPSSIHLQTSNHVVVEDLLLGTQAAGVSIVTGSHSRILRNIDGSNGLMQANCPSILKDNVTAGFVSGLVFDAGHQCVYQHNRALNFGAAISE